MITKQVWYEMHKAKGYLLQIDIYGNKKRRQNRMLSIAIVAFSSICAISSFFPKWQWCTIAASVIVAISTIAKEFLPALVQPESELRDLDNIRHFYDDYLRRLEKLFRDRNNKNSDIGDNKMNNIYNRIKKTETETDYESKLNIITHKLSKKEEEYIESEINKYFNSNFLNEYVEQK